MTRKYKSVLSQRPQAIHEAVLVSTCIGITVGLSSFCSEVEGNGAGSPIVPKKEFSVLVETICTENI
eukprot:2992337-Rhodomonas_salina.1